MTDGDGPENGHGADERGDGTAGDDAVEDAKRDPSVEEPDRGTPEERDSDEGERPADTSTGEQPTAGDDESAGDEVEPGADDEADPPGDGDESGEEHDEESAEDGEARGGDEGEWAVDEDALSPVERRHAEEGVSEVTWDPEELESEIEPVDWDPDDPDTDLEPLDDIDAAVDSIAAEAGHGDAERMPSRDKPPKRVEGPGDDVAIDRQPAGQTAAGAPYRGEPLPEGEGGHAPDDEEMPLADHIEEMVRRLGVVLVLMVGVSAVVFPFGERIINVIWYSFLPGTYELCPTTSVVPREPGVLLAAVANDVGAGPGVTLAETASIKPACPRVYNPLATILARFKVATLAGFVVALPAFVYETYLFMRPGLYPRERRYYLAAVPTSLILAAIGVAFAYLIVLPSIFTYFLYYSQGAADIAFGLSQTFDLMVLMLGFFAAIFQIPLFIMLAIMMGVTSRQWLADRRLLFWAAFAGIAFIFNPDPTGMAPFIVAATMIVLFEGTLLLLSWTGSEGILPSPRAVAARRPYAWLLAGVAAYLASDAPVPEGYYEQLPDLLRGFIESNDLIGMTPLVVGGLLIAGYELVVFVLRRYLRVGAWRRRLFTGRVSLFRLRAPVWILSLTVGYLTSPNPFLLDRARSVTLAPVEAGALAVGLIVAFEGLLAVWTLLRPEDGERLPLER